MTEYCEKCEMQIVGKVFELDGEPVCQDCYENEIGRAEVLVENEREGNFND